MRLFLYLMRAVRNTIIKVFEMELKKSRTQMVGFEEEMEMELYICLMTQTGIIKLAQISTAVSLLLAHLYSHRCPRYRYHLRY